ncbi:hypothetical protein H924_03440 [Corynebacterium callunae DSM 20147]|uniref:Uncharacterized protein n=1 Tax=Corynebacterium callunae DSM 20147 TaxID=1121353 RepID=M1TP74_9CORY|nr:hypothetical protein H924_03440 [Corynebacterium callunae DSM 20147]
MTRHEFRHLRTTLLPAGADMRAHRGVETLWVEVGDGPQPIRRVKRYAYQRRYLAGDWDVIARASENGVRNQVFKMGESGDWNEYG